MHPAVRSRAGVSRRAPTAAFDPRFWLVAQNTPAPAPGRGAAPNLQSLICHRPNYGNYGAQSAHRPFTVLTVLPVPNRPIGIAQSPNRLQLLKLQYVQEITISSKPPEGPQCAAKSDAP